MQACVLLATKHAQSVLAHQILSVIAQYVLLDFYFLLPMFATNVMEVVRIALDSILTNVHLASKAIFWKAINAITLVLLAFME